MCPRPRRFFIGTWNMKGFLNEDRPVQTLRQVLTKLRNAYCSTTGYEVRLATVAVLRNACSLLLP